MARSLGWMPIVAATCILIGIIVPYIIAVHLDHVYPILPVISDTGALHPENCVFGQMLNIGSALMCAMVYLRYRQIKQYYKDGPKDLSDLNIVSCTFGYFTAIGFSIVANVEIDVFAETSVESSVHLFGAVLGFNGGIFYGFTQSWLTYLIGTDSWSWVFALLRLVLSVFAGIFGITLLKFRQLANAEFNGTYYQTLQWNPYDGGYEYHLISAISEYLMAITLTILILTMYKEFRTIFPVQQKPPKEKKAHVISTNKLLAELGKVEI